MCRLCSTPHRPGNGSLLGRAPRIRSCVWACKRTPKGRWCRTPYPPGVHGSSYRRSPRPVRRGTRVSAGAPAGSAVRASGRGSAPGAGAGAPASPGWADAAAADDRVLLRPGSADGSWCSLRPRVVAGNAQPGPAGSASRPSGDSPMLPAAWQSSTWYYAMVAPREQAGGCAEMARLLRHAHAQPWGRHDPDRVSRSLAQTSHQCGGLQRRRRRPAAPMTAIIASLVLE
jgi:hypothetical protein